MNTLSLPENSSPHKTLAEFFITAKEQGYVLLSNEDLPVAIPQSSYAPSQLKQWISKFQEFISDPHSCPYNRYGYGFEFMTFLSIRSQSPELTVLPTPASLDFVEPGSGIPSSDIVVGHTIAPGIIKPVYFIRTSLRERKKNQLHPLFDVSLISLSAIDCMSRRTVEDTLYKFAIEDFGKFTKDSGVPQRILEQIAAKLSTP